MAAQRLHVAISGRVQGVWFRASTREQAARLGLTGWVRNLADGRVEAVLEGERESLQPMLDWCWTGPPGARVDRVDARWSAATLEFGEFSVLP